MEINEYIPDRILEVSYEATHVYRISLLEA